MEAGKGPADEPVPLKAQIADAERRILDRQQRIRRHVISCKHDVASSITSAPVLLSAGGMGFVIGMLTRRQPPSLVGSRADAAPHGSGLFDTVLKSAALIRSLFPARR